MIKYDIDQLERDFQLSLLRGVKFRVAVKEAKGKRWEHVQPDLLNLKDAMKLTERTNAFEVAVFAVSDTGGGFFYWSSRNPDLLSSNIVASI